jgi:HSP20 family protein
VSDTISGTKTFGPLLEVARIQSEINRLFDNLTDLGSEGGAGGAWIPNADILETEETLILHVELPGVPMDRLSVSVLGGNVVLRGEKVAPESPAGANYHVAERAFGPFRRMVNLGVPVNTRQARAVLKNGLLRICFPKVPNRRGEEVPIRVADE